MDRLSSVRIAEMSEQLTNEWRQWRTAPRDTRRFIEAGHHPRRRRARALRRDASNPHHVTVHYNGWAGPNPNGYAIDCGTHDRFERYFVSHAMATSDSRHA